MKTYSKEELALILDNHKKWLSNEKEGVRANLSNADLCSADLRYADLRSANLSNAILSNTNLRFTDLSCADLSYANLSWANLSYSKLSYTNLHSANLSNANLHSTNLCTAFLSDADLNNTYLINVIGDLIYIKSVQLEKYCITYTSKIIQISCKNYTINEWKNFDDATISKMDDGALDWWRKWKPVLMQIIEMSPCVDTKEGND